MRSLVALLVASVVVMEALQVAAVTRQLQEKELKLTAQRQLQTDGSNIVPKANSGGSSSYTRSFENELSAHTNCESGRQHDYLEDRKPKPSPRRRGHESPKF